MFSIAVAEEYMKQIGAVLEAVQKREEETRRMFEIFDRVAHCPVQYILTGLLNSETYSLITSQLA